MALLNVYNAHITVADQGVLTSKAWANTGAPKPTAVIK